jgi:hypothetical protein
MNNIIEKYEDLVAEEDTLIKRIQTCEECVLVILDYIAKKADSIHVLTVEDVVSAVHVIGKDLQNI